MKEYSEIENIIEGLKISMTENSLRVENINEGIFND